MLKRLLRRPGTQAFLGRVAALYLRFVRATSRFVLVPSDIYERVEPDLPVIIAMWHGEHFLMPFIRRPHHKVKVLISRHRDGEINAVAAERLGIGLIRGSGSHGSQNIDKRGAAALIEMIRALEDGYAVATTADVPKVAKRAGMGIVTLARHSGRPIYPAAVVTSRHWRIEKAWDKSAFPLPFGRMVVAHGPPVRVPPDADEATLEAARLAVERGLEEANARAYDVAAGRRPG
jgi:lysophospholipid acyltransferase (LPLAT)-like uncharacterized protein